MTRFILAFFVITYGFTGYAFLTALDKVVPDRAPVGLAARVSVVVMWPRLLVQMHVRHILGSREPAGTQPWGGAV